MARTEERAKKQHENKCTIQKITQNVNTLTKTLLIIGLGLLFALVHIANDWLFAFTAFSPNVSLIYLPAFLRLLHVLVLGKIRGTLATLLGGLVLLVADNPDNPLQFEVVSILCSAAAPLLAMLAFEQIRARHVSLTSLNDLVLVTLIYSLFNSLLHHFAWAVFSDQPLGSAQQMMMMALGDLTGAMLGAYVLKWTALRLNIGRAR
jgi:hypothetical protein